MNELTDLEPLRDALQKVARKIDPQATLLRAWSLAGGFSAQMIALEIALSPTQTRKLIVRQAGASTLRRNPQAVAEEFAILQRLQGAEGLPHAAVMAPRPLLLDTSATLLPDAYMVIDYIEGAPDYAPADPLHAVAQMATQLARIHQVHVGGQEWGQEGALAFLPRSADRLLARLQPPPILDESLQEGAVRGALAGFSPQSSAGAERLLHGDFWPGNLLWRAGELVGVIDWEDAALGNPLEDFAIARLDIAWFYGDAAMHHFSAAYRAAWVDATRPSSGVDTSGVDFQKLPYWDLLAALRPCGHLAEWATGWAALGRPDVTAVHMAAVHRRFVEQALGALKL